MFIKSNLVDHAKCTQLAIDLIRLGCRLQVIQIETGLNRNYVHKLYLDVMGGSPKKGQLPNSHDYFLVTKERNVQASLFINIYNKIKDISSISHIEAVITTYKLYLEHAQSVSIKPVLSFTRAYVLVKLISSKVLELTPCSKCLGKFVAIPSILNRSYYCAFCRS